MPPEFSAEGPRLARLFGFSAVQILFNRKEHKERKGQETKTLSPPGSPLIDRIGLLRQSLRYAKDID
jgi:hypothetical protein